MQVTHEQEAARENCTSNGSPANNNKYNTNGKDAKSRDIIVYKKGGTGYRRSRRVKTSELLGCNKYLKPFACLCRNDVAQACFYSTSNLRRVGSVNRRQHWIYSMKMKKEDHHHNITHKADSASHSGNKVLPITDSSALSSSSNNNTNDHHQCGPLEKNKHSDNTNKIVKGDKTKTMSRMKELLRWAAAAKSDKGGKFIGRKVLQFRNRATFKAVADDDQLSMESPKISFRWDVESCSTTTSSVYSGISMASSSMIKDQITSCNMLSLSSTPIHHDMNHCSTGRKGNWITTDAEFVVLEL